jgi:hypothetical protein
LRAKLIERRLEARQDRSIPVIEGWRRRKSDMIWSVLTAAGDWVGADGGWWESRRCCGMGDEWREQAGN